MDYSGVYDGKELPSPGDIVTVTVHSEWVPFDIRAEVTLIRDDPECPIHAQELADG